MSKIKKDDKVFYIKNKDEFCEECRYIIPNKCTLFDILIDHMVGGNVNSSGWKRCQQCIDAEIM